MTVFPLSADECGWRQYPCPGHIAFNTDDPDCYAQADVAERYMSCFQIEVQDEINRTWERAMTTGTGIMEYWNKNWSAK